MRLQMLDAEVAVLHVFATLDRGGAEIRTLEMMRRLERAGRQYVVVLSGRAGELMADFEAAGVSVSILNIRSIDFPFRLHQLLLHRRIDVVHAHVSLYSGYILYLAKIYGVRGRVVHFRSDSDGFPDGFAAKCQAWVLHHLLDRAANVIVGVSPSALAGSWGPNWRSDKRCRVLISGVDLDSVERGVNGAHMVRAGLGLGESQRLVLHVGRDIGTKNRARALEVFAGMKRWSSFVLLFVGRDDAANQARLQARASQLGVSQSVLFLGERTDVPQLMAAANLVLVTSTLEGMPGVVLEASAAGTPVLASDLEGTKYVADRIDGITVLSQGSSDASWAEAAEHLVESSLLAVDRKARISSLRGSEFDVAAAVDGYFDLWAAAARGGRTEP